MYEEEKKKTDVPFSFYFVYFEVSGAEEKKNVYVICSKKGNLRSMF